MRMRRLLTAVMTVIMLLTAASVFAEDGPKLQEGNTEHEHFWAEIWSVDEQAGTHYRKCMAEGCTARTDEAAHQYNQQYVQKVDESTHQQVCDICGEMTGVKSLHSFIYISGEEGMHSVSCADSCGLELLTAHVWNQKTDETKHWEECACGEKRNEAAHTWEKKTDAEKHWEECVCGEKRNEAVHTPGTSVQENVVDSKPGTEGSYDEVTYCTVCEAELSRSSVTTPALPEDKEPEHEETEAFTVTFLDGDGSTLATGEWQTGEKPVYSGKTPVKAVSNEFIYEFAGWDPEIYAADKDQVYTPVFTAKDRLYTVTFEDDDGTVLQTGRLKYGEMPAYNGEEPSKPDNEYYGTIFLGWNPDVAAVTADTAYRAVYEQDYYYYAVMFDFPECEETQDISIPDQRVRAGKTVSDPGPLPDISHTCSWHFEFWSDSSLQLQPYDFSKPVSRDFMLYAIYATDDGNMKTGNEIFNSGNGCFIATCVYGSYDCPEVWTLRRFRDNTLAASSFGRAFIRKYYELSPKIVEKYGNTAWFRPVFKPGLDWFVTYLRSRGYEDTPYEDPE